MMHLGLKTIKRYIVECNRISKNPKLDLLSYFCVFNAIRIIQNLNVKVGHGVRRSIWSCLFTDSALAAPYHSESYLIPPPCKQRKMHHKLEQHNEAALSLQNALSVFF
jgi:hypothetical protein